MQPFPQENFQRVPQQTPQLYLYENLTALLEARFGQAVSLVQQSLFQMTSFGTLYQLTLSNHQKLIMKQGKGKHAKAMGEAEGFGLTMIDYVQGLEHAQGLEYAGGIKTPRCLGMIDDAHGSLVCSFIETHNKQNPLISEDKFWECFAENLGALHQSAQDVSSSKNNMPYFGLYKEGEVYHNFIGGTEQDNTIEYSWVRFFAEHRIWKQCEIAERKGYFTTQDMNRARKLCDTLQDYINEPPFASLLHGDLWAGNFLRDEKQNAVVIDPAVYYGHYEADIAFTELFGGFHASFYDAYAEILPVDRALDKAYHTVRKNIYNLYHLLNHLNLFGNSYLSACRNIILRYT